MTNRLSSYRVIILIILSILACSYWGRTAWNFLSPLIGRSGITLLLVVIAVLVAYIGRIRIWASLVAALFVLALYFVFGFLAEELLHCILFGALGFKCAELVIQSAASRTHMIIFGLSASIGDELFQAWLPDRVGDVYDVLLNAASFLLVFAYRLNVHHSNKDTQRS